MTKLENSVAGVLIMCGGIVLGAAIYHHLAQVTFKPPAPASASDPVSAKAKAFGVEVLKTYGDAWRDGARKLDAGSTMEAAIAQVGTSWQTGRTDLYARTITPILSAIIPEGTLDADQTAKQRAAAAAAFRSIAAGLSD